MDKATELLKEMGEEDKNESLKAKNQKLQPFVDLVSSIYLNNTATDDVKKAKGLVGDWNVGKANLDQEIGDKLKKKFDKAQNLFIDGFELLGDLVQDVAKLK